MDFNDVVDIFCDALMSTTFSDEKDAREQAYRIADWLDRHNVVVNTR